MAFLKIIKHLISKERLKHLFKRFFLLFPPHLFKNVKVPWNPAGGSISCLTYHAAGRLAVLHVARRTFFLKGVTTRKKICIMFQDNCAASEAAKLLIVAVNPNRAACSAQTHRRRLYGAAISNTWPCFHPSSSPLCLNQEDAFPRPVSFPQNCWWPRKKIPLTG